MGKQNAIYPANCSTILLELPELDKKLEEVQVKFKEKYYSIQKPSKELVDLYMLFQKYDSLRNINILPLLNTSMAQFVSLLDKKKMMKIDDSEKLFLESHSADKEFSQIKKHYLFILDGIDLAISILDEVFWMKSLWI